MLAGKRGSRQMPNTIYDEGRRAYLGRIDPRKCPYSDEACREAWMKGWYDAKSEEDGNFRSDDAKQT